MRRSLIIISFLVLTGQLLSAQPFMTNISARQYTSLNGEWQVIVDMLDYGHKRNLIKNETSETKGHFVEYSFDDSSTLKVPGDWNSQRTELKYYESSIWYKKDFDWPDAGNGRCFLYFGAANYLADVYLNGEFVGSHEGGFTPFEFEITGRVKEKNNFLIVRVNSKRTPENIPAIKYDWWNYGGLTRDVYLVKTENTYIRDYSVGLAEGCTDKIKVEIRLDGCSERENVVFSIPELGVKKKLKTDKEGFATAVVNADIQLWTPSCPKLYTVSFTRGDETISEKIGFRTVEASDGKIFLNGSEIFLKGINCHDEIPQEGRRAYSDEDARMLLSEVKNLGCNFLRLTHYPQSENMVRMAEEMGILLWEEIPLWQGIAFSNPGTLPKASHMLDEMISRDKNRCAIILWSVSNETKPGEDRNALLKALIDHARELDPSRLITTAFSHTEGTPTSVTLKNDPVCAYVDVIGINKYYGWYEIIGCAPEEYKWDIPFGKPVIFSEFGAEALYGNHGDASVSSEWYEEYQKKVYEDDLKMVENIPNLAGLTPWCLFDFRSPYRFNHKYQNEWNRKGLLSNNGERKMAWYVMKDYYDRH